MELQFRKCTTKDIDILLPFSKACFYETYISMNTAENMENYINTAFSYNCLKKELENPHSFFYALFSGRELVGYLKLNTHAAQNDIHDEAALEIERIYVSKAHHGKKLGQYLMDKAVEIAKEQKKTYLWLGVWEKNTHAIGFYTKNGFYKIKEHWFQVGEEKQLDFVLQKDLSAAVSP